MGKRKEKKKSGSKFLIFILLVLIIVAGVLLAMKIMKDQGIGNFGEMAGEGNKKQEEITLRVPKTFAGTERAIALMIDNNTNAWPQGGLNDADLVYEIIVEGGETRLMAIFKGKTLEKIGPVRSARHYFIDYALEHDAIFTHFGESPQAEYDVNLYKVDDINGIAESATSFWRTKDKAAPHNVATSIEKILEIATRKKYRTTSDIKSVLNYNVDEVALADGEDILSVTIPYSTYHKVEYKYDENTKTFIRYARGKEQKDWSTGELVRTKNIIITFAENYTLNDVENKGRQGLKNIGILDGYYITNGKAIKITCEKSSRTEKTIYKDLSGNEIQVNDGNTFVQICPKDSKVTFEKPVVDVVENTLEANTL